MVLTFTLGLTLVVAGPLSHAPKLAREHALGATLAAGGKRTIGGVKRLRPVSLNTSATACRCSSTGTSD